jgi:hypothetical protein
MSEEEHPGFEIVGERTFGWWDMFVHPDEDPRADGGFDNNERAMLLGFLDDRRLTLELKCRGLDARAMARQSVPPSDLSLLGLVRHLAGVERIWFQGAIAGRDVDRPFRHEFEVAADDEMVAEAWETWRREVDASRQIVAGIDDLGELGRGTARPVREVLVHLIREYAQHMGHADLLRERIDGRVGQ